jgi:hypothetical protein
MNDPTWINRRGSRKTHCDKSHWAHKIKYGLEVLVEDRGIEIPRFAVIFQDDGVSPIRYGRPDHRACVDADLFVRNSCRRRIIKL